MKLGLDRHHFPTLGAQQSKSDEGASEGKGRGGAGECSWAGEFVCVLVLVMGKEESGGGGKGGYVGSLLRLTCFRSIVNGSVQKWDNKNLGEKKTLLKGKKPPHSKQLF